MKTNISHTFTVTLNVPGPYGGYHMYTETLEFDLFRLKDGYLCNSLASSSEPTSHHGAIYWAVKALIPHGQTKKEPRETWHYITAELIEDTFTVLAHKKFKRQRHVG